jgi:hypothetical protein
VAKPWLNSYNLKFLKVAISTRRENEESTLFQNYDLDLLLLHCGHFGGTACDWKYRESPNYWWGRNTLGNPALLLTREVMAQVRKAPLRLTAVTAKLFNLVRR